MIILTPGICCSCSLVFTWQGIYPWFDSRRRQKSLWGCTRKAIWCKIVTNVIVCQFSTKGFSSLFVTLSDLILYIWFAHFIYKKKPRVGTPCLAYVYGLQWANSRKKMNERTVTVSRRVDRRWDGSRHKERQGGKENGEGEEEEEGGR